MKNRLVCIQQNGFCVVENVIPPASVRSIRETLFEVQAAHNEEGEAELAAIRARGHRVGAKGVGVLKQVINETQCFASYLADREILDLVEAFFGPFVRISCTDCVVNHPGNDRGYWHADWPFNQTNASRIPAPYADAMVHLSTIWMLTEFSEQTGGTLVIPESHRIPENPSASTMDGIDPDASSEREIQISGSAGSVLIYDSRLWHAVAPNRSTEPRVALIVRYAPWWLNLNPTMMGTPEHTRMVVETGGKNYENLPVRGEVYDRLPEDVKPLYRHWVK